MNLYEKLQRVKVEILESSLKKSGLNKFAGYTYYELSDFLPTIIQSCDKNKVFTYVNFDNELSTLTAINAEKCDETLTISSPMRTLGLKGCNEIQSLGGIETYSRRYLYMAMFDITENDMFDGNDKKSNEPKEPKEKEYKCCECGAQFKPYESNSKQYTAEDAFKAVIARATDGKARCKSCRDKLKADKSKP